jgi:hypothetical protein
VPQALSAGVFQHYFMPIVVNGETWRGFPYVLEAEARPMIESGTWQFSAQQPATSWIQSELGYVVQPDAHHASFLSLEETKAALAHHSLPIEQTPLPFQVLLGALAQLETLSKGARSRIVFWFNG